MILLERTLLYILHELGGQGAGRPGAKAEKKRPIKKCIFIK